MNSYITGHNESKFLMWCMKQEIGVCVVCVCVMSSIGTVNTFYPRDDLTDSSSFGDLTCYSKTHVLSLHSNKPTEPFITGMQLRLFLAN